MPRNVISANGGVHVKTKRSHETKAKNANSSPIGGRQLPRGEEFARSAERLVVGAFFFDQGADPFAQEGDVEGLLEEFVEAVGRQSFGIGFVFAGQSNDHRRFVGRVAAKIAGDLQGFRAAHGQIDDDAVGMEAFGLDAGFETGVGDFELEVVVFGEDFLEAVDEELLGADDEDLVQAFFFELAQGHAVLFEELDEVFAGDAAILTARDAVSAQSARIEPLTHRPRRDFANLRDLSGGEDFFHGRHSTV